MTALRLVTAGLVLLLGALLLVASFSSWTEQSVFAVRFWLLQVLTLTGCGLTVAGAVVGALRRSAPAASADAAVDHFG